MGRLGDSEVAGTGWPLGRPPPRHPDVRPNLPISQSANLPLYRCAVTFEELHALVVRRKREMPEGSSTAELLAGGPHAIGKKLVEEAAESWMAARYESAEALTSELAQVLYYVACMMAEKDIPLEDVYRAL